MMDKEYKRICDKLGFVPSEYSFPQTDGEDDNWKNPFLKLTLDEIEYLYKSGYLDKTKSTP